MTWKKLLDTKDLIAYEKSTKKSKITIEARLKKNKWRVYKTYNFQGTERISHVKEYIASSLAEARQLLSELKDEQELSWKDLDSSKTIKLDMSRCYKEEYVEKWKFQIDDFSDDNIIIARFDSEVHLDIILHEKYNHLEKVLLEKLIDVLGLKEISNKIRYDFFYFKRHSAKKRVYEKPSARDLIAQIELDLENKEM
ncbi:MAG: hypothetical protein ACMXX5_00220 [Candidatus Woesearchaeota archaeon]